MRPSFFSTICFGIACWCLLVITQGYRYGSEDHIEHLPYVLFLAGKAGYANDFFIQNLHAAVPNERTVICHILLPFVNHLEFACFLLHLITTVAMIAGLERLGCWLSDDLTVTRIAILLNFLLFFDRGLGNVELYTDTIQGSSISVALLAWALYFFFSNRYVLASAISALGTIVHPVEGLCVYSVIAGVMFYDAIRHRSARYFIRPVSMYVVLAVPYILWLLSDKMSGNTNTGNEIDSETYYSIYHVFRL
ncbi:MAG: hypothetical protein NZM35_12085, partial [Chitinophagales bacterium]|nr:hypothetical protein [Chitinophagales bacterium]MDW8419981.1 hypothetical protein [Chitinophagales bacterium]